MDFTHGLDNISYFWTVKEGDALGVVERGEGGKLVSLVYWIVLLNVVVMAVGGLVPLKSISTDVVTHSLTHSAALFQFRVSKILLSLCR